MSDRARASTPRTNPGRELRTPANKGGIGGKVVGTVPGVPQHASLFSPVADVPSPTNSVPIFSLDSG